MYYLTNTYIRNEVGVCHGISIPTVRFFLQIVERIEMDIISGVYQPGQRLPAVRELASCAAVNPNTMQRALSELERTGLVYSQRTSGRFITEDTAMIEGLKQQIAEEKIHDFFEAMKHLGMSKEETLQLIQQHTTI